MLLKKLFSQRKNKPTKIIGWSNVIQYDEMGYPLRLVMIDIGNGLVDHVWRDTDETEGDVVLKWKKL